MSRNQEYSVTVNEYGVEVIGNNQVRLLYITHEFVHHKELIFYVKTVFAFLDELQKTGEKNGK